MKALYFSSGIIKKWWIQLLFIAFFLLLFAANSFGSSQDDVLLIVHDREITRNEFLYHFQKNNQEINQQNITEYLESFVNFQLKLAEAREERLHQNRGFKNELLEYRLILAAPYFTDKEKERELAREAYERLKFEVSASYILVKFASDPGYDDIIEAYAKAIQIRNRIIGGEAFEQIDISKSDGFQVIRSSGKFDYFTAFQTDYSFESTVYNMKPGEISMPVLSNQGYYIVQFNDKRKTSGEVKVAHLMINFERYNEEEAKDKITQIHDLIKSGSDFENMVLEYSTDSGTVGSGGVFPWFSSESSSSEIWKTAMSLKEMGSVSNPIRTNSGWHIIKVLDRRALAPFKEMEAEIKTLITEANDERIKMIEGSFAEGLKSDWDFKENLDALEIIYEHADERVFSGNWIAPSHLPFDETLFLIDGKKVNQRSFIDFMNGNEHYGGEISIEEFIFSVYQKFVSARLRTYENFKLEDKYPEFRFKYEEYRDAMLLLQITKQKVWLKAESDREGLEKFFTENKKIYACF